MDRRTFLKLQMQGLLWLTAGGSVSTAFAESVTTTAAYPHVAVAKGSPAAAARGAVELIGGMKRFVKPGQKVVIKPNMSFAKGPEFATNTHPEVVAAVVRMCKEAKAGKILVLDHSLHDPKQSLEKSGILDACNAIEKNICFHLMENRFYKEENIPGGVSMKKNSFMRDVLEADVVIAVPVAKSHGSTGVSLSLKGQMGLILNRRIMHYLHNLDESIVDLNIRVKPSLAIIDATRVLTSGGPGGPGKVITPGEVIASADPVAADATAVASYEWYGKKMTPLQVSHISLAHKRGLGRMDIENLPIKRITV
jgi:uncharacterized protein (DUF362 family)